MIRQLLAALTCGLALALPAGAGSDIAPSSIQLIVNRSDDNVDIYLTLPASEIADLFGSEQNLWATEDGRVDLNQFQVDTAPLGDAIIEPVKVTVDGQPVIAEAISVMMHEMTVSVPFDAPWDAILAVTLCSVPITNPTPAVSEVQAYLGYNLYEINGLGEISLSPTSFAQSRT
ncbi:MAG: hypothetical protein AAGL89_13140, partial [Pseudomonadota bacterium]